jgi:prevent-host-death family protein
MASVTAFEAKTRFGQLLKRVAEGEEVVITKHDKPVARLVPEGRATLDSVRKTVSNLRALRKRIADRTSAKAKLSLDDFKSARDQGRK